MAKRNTTTPQQSDPYTGEGDDGATGKDYASYTPSRLDPYTEGKEQTTTRKVSPEEAIQRTHRDRK